MKKKYIILWATFFALVFLPSIAFPWGSATHTYIDDNLGKKWGLKNMDEIYGGMSPDIFNFMFDKPVYMSYLYYQTHNKFVKLWKESRHGNEKTLAYGFVSHNDVWGADSTAHHSGITYGQDEGYIIAKAVILKGILESVPEYQALELPDSVALVVSHNLVESGVDILMKRIDPMIGQKMISSALLRSPEFPLLLVNAYAKDFSKYAKITYLDAVKIIISAEREFRKTTILYGQALTQDEAIAIQLISEQMAELSEAFLAAYGIILPSGTYLTPLIKFAIERSMDICANDFSDEIEATIDYVDQQLNSYGISY
jgi:hypothetical protein